MDIGPGQSVPAGFAHSWAPGLTRVPYWVYRDPEVAKAEQERIFQGPVWNYLCLEVEIPNQGDYRTTSVGSMPVIVVRGEGGAIHAFENRCAHRGALICLENEGSGAKDFHCVYHAWRYDLQGNLQSIAFRRGVNGEGGMPDDFDMAAIGPRKLRVATFCGLVFGTLSDATPPVEEFLGAIGPRIRRVLHKPVEVIGRFTQPLPNNWKLYVENVKDTYHASLLHLFFATFRITRLTQGGGTTVSEDGGHHASATMAPTQTVDTAYRDAGFRSDDANVRLSDTSMLEVRDEWDDSVRLQMVAVFPTLIVQQIHNCLAIRQVVPRGVDRMDLHWTYIGYADDTPEMRTLRLKQSNLVGPAGFVSMEDGCVGGFVQRGTEAAELEQGVVMMGGSGYGTQTTRATETAIRGFWNVWRGLMGV